MSDHTSDHTAPGPWQPSWWPEGPIPAPSTQTAVAPPVGPEASTPPVPPRRAGVGVVLSVALIGGIIGGLAVLGTLSATGALDGAPVVAATVPDTGATVVVNRPPATTGTLDSDVAKVAESVLPSVVRVAVYTAIPGQTSGDFNDRFRPLGTGSGVGFTPEGHILTNNHVVEGADMIRIELVDGRVYEAELVGRDQLTDVAVIKVAPGIVAPLPLADRADLGIGDVAIAIGNPLGLAGGPSVSVGVISAFERQLDITRQDGSSQNLQGLIQTDAAISGGSSGGALVDATGSLIGITTAKSVGESTEGVGFAVPVDLVENIALDLIRDGRVVHPFLGIIGTTHYRTLADGAEVPAGAEVVRIIGGEADDPVTESAFGIAGARVGDVIVAVDDIAITDMNQLASLLRRYRAGQDVDVAIERGTTTLEITVTLDARPEGT